MMQFLEGEITSDGHRGPLADDLATAQRENRELRRALADAETRAADAERRATRALAELRRQLNPLYRALQAVFGELDALGTEDVGSSAPQTSPGPAAVWNAWKSKLGGGAAKVIDALLLHREMNTQQLAIATGLHRTSIPRLIYTLNQAGLINKSNGRFSLKSLG